MYKLLTTILIVITVALSFPLSASASAKDRGLYTHMKIGIMGNIALTQEQIDGAKKDGKYDFSDIFDGSADILRDMDITAGFLGMPICRDGAPAELAAAKDAGIDFLSTASRHTLDRGESGLRETLDTLDENGIRHSGSYRNEEQSTEPTVITVNGIETAFFSYTTDTIRELPKESSSYVSVLGSHSEISEDVSSETADAWSVLALPQRKYLKQVEGEISSVRDDVDFIIAFVSCDGTDSEDYKSTWADIMIRAAADFVAFSDGETVGSMEYKVMKIDETHGRRTAYFHSVGNASSAIQTESSDEGIIFVLTLGTLDGATYIKAAQFIPMYIDSGRMIPVYDYLKYSGISDEKRVRMSQINDRQTAMLMRAEDDKRLRSIYQIKPYVGNSQSADVVASYTGRLFILSCAAAVFLIITAVLIFRGRQLAAIIKKSRINEGKEISRK